jgi:hypothetical protein
MVLSASPVESLTSRFLTIAPRIEHHARIYFRDIWYRQTRLDYVAETLAIAWKAFLRLAQKGRDAVQFVGKLARYAARAVRSGRKLAGSDRVNDPLSPRARRRHGFRLERLQFSRRLPIEKLHRPRGQRELELIEEALHDNAETPPPDAAAFRVDFLLYLARLSERDRAVALYLAEGHRPGEAAAAFGLSRGRLSQMRHELSRKWHELHGEPVPA